MKKTLLTASVLTVCAAAGLAFQSSAGADTARWRAQARRVTIVRDNWGIAHVSGKTDADAVFGGIYAQAEDDFNRIETNYLTQLGRLGESEGEARLYGDLRYKMYYDTDMLTAEYAQSPGWMKTLMVAWADGLNFYLSTHPAVKPHVITRFEPWMALSFTEGSIGGDIEKIRPQDLQAFYGGATTGALAADRDPLDDEPRGSNGAAISPSNTTTKRALLLINPHTSFFFRSELQMTSDEGLNAYGAATWGQFFLYQGFNDRIGWMHTTSAVDDTDEFIETVTKKGDGYVYKYGNEERPVTSRVLTVNYKTPTGMAKKTFTVFYTHHGPIVRQQGDKWVAFAMMNEPVKALEQSYTRTKARDYKSYKQIMELHTNSSNNTIFASADGDIAYFHSNFIPKRDPSFDYTKPVDGSNPATDWKGVLSFDETPNLFNPASGWLYNSNNSPWSASGPSSPKQSDYPRYVDSGSQSARGLHAEKVLGNRKDFTLDGLLAAAFDSYLTWFDKPLPALFRAWDALPASDARKSQLSEQIATLKSWDQRWGVQSIPTSLAVFWGTELQRAGGRGASPESASADVMLRALVAASDKLTEDFGSWKTPWGD
ncbi:MAG TPA: penicillin acylase family protein, partial [Vicinamibacterales bacterium]|nr:penicillin acylase family protein [Vicinamibacterales bacterium]